MVHIDQINFNNPYFYRRRRKKWKTSLLILVLALTGAAFFFLGGKSNSVLVANRPWWSKITGLFLAVSDSAKEDRRRLEELFSLPEKEDGRRNFLILGIRGENDPDGGLLSDSIMLASYKEKEEKIAIISIPRDLYIEMPTLATSKANEIYEKGLAQKDSLSFVKRIFSRLTGVYIDNIVVFDFRAFQEIIDILGGIDITLEEPFRENSQWGYEFSLPAGLNHLNGEEALYYVRSRYSSSDFDRARRQQEVILAIKEKIVFLELLMHPLKTASLAGSLGNHVTTDFNILNTAGLISLASNLNEAGNKIIRKTITTENLLNQTVQNDIYILLPKDESWTEFRNFFKNIFL